MRNARVHILKVGEITKTKKYAELLFKTFRDATAIGARMHRKYFRIVDLELIHISKYNKTSEIIWYIN